MITNQDTIKYNTTIRILFHSLRGSFLNGIKGLHLKKILKKYKNPLGF